MPSVILAASEYGNGYLNHRQRNIQSLSLITDNSCNQRSTESLRLSFSHLSSFSWRGARSTNDLSALRDVLQANRSSLKQLTVDIMDWDELRIAIRELTRNHTAGLPNLELITNTLDQQEQISRDFAEHILDIPPGCSTPLFSSLTSLTLSCISLEDVTVMQDVSAALNFANLTTLKLIDCTGTVNWLIQVIDTKQVVRLRNLELLIESDFMGFEAVLLSDFLNTFRGLEQLLVKSSCYPSSLTDPDLIDIYKGLLNHKSTLQALVLHDKDLNEDELYQHPSFLDYEERWRDTMVQLLHCSALKFLGVSETSAFLVC